MANTFGKSWITSLGGLIAAIGGLIGLLPQSLGIDPSWGAFVVALAAVVTGFGAKDANVHSTHVEIQQSTREVKAQDKADKDAAVQDIKASGA